MRSDQGGVLAENDPAGHMVRFLAGLHVQSGTAARGPVYCFLQVDLIGFRAVFRQYIELANTDGAGCPAEISRGGLSICECQACHSSR